MAYRLRQTKSIADGLRRLASKELRAARKALRRGAPPDDEAIHETRRHLKKGRAILQLVKADGGRGLGGSRKRMRTVNRTLSSLRDADVMNETLTKLMKKDPHLVSEHTLARTRRQLSSHAQTAKAAAQRDGAWRRVDRDVRKVLRTTKGWKTKHRGFGALAPGIRSSHARGRKALACARERGAAADFHEWRKAVKALWYALRLIDACAPGVRRDRDALHRAEVFLGDDHNLVVLCNTLSKDASARGGLIHLDRLRHAADRYQRDLRKKAIASAQRIYARRSGKYVRSLEQAWKAWRHSELIQRSRPTAA